MAQIQFQYAANTGIASSKPFQKKLLADHTVNIGNACSLGCSYCYVPDMTFKHKSLKNIENKGYTLRQISNYRNHSNVVSTVTRDLKKNNLKENETVFFCSTCDPCASAANVKTTIAAAKLILQGSKSQIRVLSKSDRIIDVALVLSHYKDRVIYGLSTGTCLDEISNSIEGNASPIKERVAALHWLQNNGYRTYGMICPVLPSEKGRVKELLDQVRPENCEAVWVEAINDKGTSLTNTLTALQHSDLDFHAYAIKAIMQSKDQWRQYTQELYLGFRRELRKQNMMHKLHYLQYTTKADINFFMPKQGTVCL